MNVFIAGGEEDEEEIKLKANTEDIELRVVDKRT